MHRLNNVSPHGGLSSVTDKINCEQDSLCRCNTPPNYSQPCGTYFRLLGLVLSLALLQHLLSTESLLDCFRGRRSETILALDDYCPQVDTLTLSEHEDLLEWLDAEFRSTEFRLKAYESLGGAVRIPTECYDDIGPPLEDSRWEIMTEFHKYLESRFPRVHANLKRTKVNTYALVYEWMGTERVKPLLIAAHMDVVPVNPDTYDDWVYPPYSGYYDGEWIWGRGSCDDKPGVIGSLTAIETLLERGFVPSRTVLLAFGVDEERGGPTVSHAIAPYLLETYGSDSLAMIVDEGDTFTELNGMVFARPAVAEKGAMDVRMDVLTPGGHSSTPPKHTGIGILADLITELESHPHQPELIRGRTYHQSLECRAKYDTGFPASLTDLLLKARVSDARLQELGSHLVEFDPLYFAMAGTTQAIDLVGGGVKVNALPEVAWAVANYRIADYSSPAQLMGYFTQVALPVAAKHNMTLEAFGHIVGSQGPSRGTIRLYDAYNNALSPAPVTPTTGSGPYQLLSGTIRSTFETHLRKDALPKSSIVTPWLAIGNTDSRHYWNLTRHIFRYHHLGNLDLYNGVHTINEAHRAEGFLEQIRFFTRLILNADRSDLLE